MSDYIKREDAIAVAEPLIISIEGFRQHNQAIRLYQQEIKELPSADVVEREVFEGLEHNAYDEGYQKGLDDCQNCEYRKERKRGEWIPCSERLPEEDGEYLVTSPLIDGARAVDCMYYGKPLMPNREVDGKCWYEADDEYGDVVWDDIIAWRPLPTPYVSDRKE